MSLELNAHLSLLSAVLPIRGEDLAARGVCVPDLVAIQASLSPDSVAVMSSTQQITYRELDMQSAQLAHHLRARGIGPCSLVALCLERSIEMVVAALAVLKAGAAYLPLDPAYPSERLSFMLHDAQVTLLIVRSDDDTYGLLGAWQTIALDTLHSELDNETADTFVSRAMPDDVAYVVYTSGSTGSPKGVEITHASLLNLVSWHHRAFALTAQDRTTHLASVAFDAAVWEIWPTLAAGACLIIIPEEVRETPWQIRDWLVTQQITISFLPTPLAEAVLSLNWPTNTALRLLLTGADTLHTYPLADLPFALINNYGPTEATVVATSCRIDPLDTTGVCGPGRPPIGAPIANAHVYILDDQLNPLPTGVAGELYIGGAGVARGYLHRPDLTAERFLPDPFSDSAGARLYKTGDMACWRADGMIDFLGRLDDQAKIRGHRVEPGEIVDTLNRHPSVQASVVIARDGHGGDKQLIAYVVPRTEAGPGLHPEAHPEAHDLRDFLAARLPDFMLPATYMWLDALPMTINGKVDRAALPIPDVNLRTTQTAYVAPHSPIEIQLANILKALLGLPQVGVADNFFLLGGNSLLGAQVIARVHDTFGINVTLRHLFAAPTISALSAEIERLLITRLEAMTDEEAQILLTQLSEPVAVNN